MWEMFPFYPSRFFGRSNNHITKRQIIGKNTKLYHIYDFPSGLDGKDSVSNAEDLVSIPGLGRYLGEGSGCPLQYSCLEYSKDRGAWGFFSPWASKSQM